MRLPIPNMHSHYTSHHLQALPSIHFQINIKTFCRRQMLRGVHMDSSTSIVTNSTTISHHHRWQQKEKILVIMGATGCGKTKMSIDLATRFGQSEIINSDKMQVYKGLDITTNKIPIHERLGVTHHLLGEFDPEDGELTPNEFRSTAGLAIQDVVSRQKLPIIVGGSNSLIHALVVDRYNPELSVFDGLNPDPVSTQLRYNCCFIWVDVSLPVLCDYLCKRVDEMLDSGMFEELCEFYNSPLGGKSASPSQTGLRRAIGVPEFDRYFRKYPPGDGGGEWDQLRKGAYEEAVREIKENTCELAKRQIGKIIRLKMGGWELQRVDATEAFREALMVGSESENENENNNNNNNNNNKNNNKKNKQEKKRKKKRWVEIWEKQVMERSMKIVKEFLEG